MIKISYIGKFAGAILPPYIFIWKPINKAKIQTMRSMQIPYTIILIYYTLYSHFKKQVEILR